MTAAEVRTTANGIDAAKAEDFQTEAAKRRGRTVPVHVQCSSSPPWSVFCLGVLAVSVFLAHIWEHVSLYQNLLTAYTHPCEPVIDVQTDSAISSISVWCKESETASSFSTSFGCGSGS